VARLVAAGPKGLAVFFDDQRGTGSDMDGALAVSDFSLGFAVSDTGSCPEKTASGLVRRLIAMLSLAPVAKSLRAAQENRRKFYDALPSRLFRKISVWREGFDRQIT
jgi:hypothetical protein